MRSKCTLNHLSKGSPKRRRKKREKDKAPRAVTLFSNSSRRESRRRIVGGGYGGGGGVVDCGCRRLGWWDGQEGGGWKPKFWARVWLTTIVLLDRQRPGCSAV